MALALLPPYHFNHHLQNPLPSPAVLLASAAMDQTNKFRPSLPSISSLIEAVTEQSEKGMRSYHLILETGKTNSDFRQEMPPLQHSVTLEGFLEAHMDME
ncbi:hypothetical protein AYO22_07162 [Fonsecaea multimorphosa]|nr:hypothetical protein AYO22_07162 [Fonsecaea multimorphosa]